MSKLRATLESGILIEAEHVEGIANGVSFHQEPVVSLDFVDDEGNVICPAEKEQQVVRDLLDVDRPNLAKRLYDEYLDSDLVQSTEDVLTLRDIVRIGSDSPASWFGDNGEVDDRFWEVVEAEHWDGL